VADSGQVTFPPKTSVAVDTMYAVGDNIWENWEQVRIIMSDPVNATLAGTGIGTATIKADDPIPGISINDVSIVEGNSGQNIVTFKVSLSNPSSDPGVRVNYTTVDGSATAGGLDYQPVSGQLTFTPKTTSLTVSVIVYGDLADEGDETFTVRLSVPRRAQIVDGEGVATIVNDDHVAVNVIKPNGGEILICGERRKLAWTAVDDKGDSLCFDLFMSRDNGATYVPIATNVCNTNEYFWDVPVSFSTDDTLGNVIYSALFRVVARSLAGKTGRDESDGTFAIHCPPTPTTLALFRAAAQPAGIELRWRFQESDNLSRVSLERAGASEGPWVLVDAEERSEGGETVALDRGVTAGQTYYYRLKASLKTGGIEVFGPVSARNGEEIKVFALTKVGPIPSRGRIGIEYTIPRQAFGRMTVVDVAGREVGVLVEGMQAPGRYTVNWNGQGNPAGVYFIRYNIAGLNITRRVVLTQ
jgi:hypothetical protein